MKYVYGLVLFCSIVLWSSCRNDFETVPSTGNLEFSRDTVFLDTVFTNIGSSTYNLKVYNTSDDDITIPTIRLGEGENSQYRLNVDGLPGKIFNDINILAKDSIFVFVETTLDIDNLPGGGWSSCMKTKYSLTRRKSTRCYLNNPSERCCFFVPRRPWRWYLRNINSR